MVPCFRAIFPGAVDHSVARGGLSGQQTGHGALESVEMEMFVSEALRLVAYIHTSFLGLFLVSLSWSRLRGA